MACVFSGVELLKAEEGSIELADLILHIVIHKRAVVRVREKEKSVCLVFASACVDMCTSE